MAPTLTPTKIEVNPAHLIGQERAKASLRQILSLAKVNRLRSERGLKVTPTTLHAIFLGSPGTGKTTFARYYAQEIEKMGALEKGHLLITVVRMHRHLLAGRELSQTRSKHHRTASLSADQERRLYSVAPFDRGYLIRLDDRRIGHRGILQWLRQAGRMSWVSLNP